MADVTTLPSAGDDASEVDELDLSYEQERLDNIKNNAALLQSLGLDTESSTRPHKPSLPGKKPGLSSAEARTRQETRARVAELKRIIKPSRRSSRVAGKKADYTTDGAQTLSSAPSPRRTPLPKQIAPVIPQGPQYDTEVEPSSPAPLPTREEDGTLVFEGRWKGIFTPNVTPEEMFAGGAFGGGFFCDTYSHVLRHPLHANVDLENLPFDPPADHATLLSNPEPDGDLNRFKVRAGQSLQEWEKAGWIWPGDPRGWAQWYVRFWGGRRCEDDERQVRRWLKVAGPTGRFKRSLMKKVHQAGGMQGGGLVDENIGRVLRQCLWQWGYELTPTEYTRAMEGGG